MDSLGNNCSFNYTVSYNAACNLSDHLNVFIYDVPNGLFVLRKKMFRKWQGLLNDTWLSITIYHTDWSKPLVVRPQAYNLKPDDMDSCTISQIQLPLKVTVRLKHLCITRV